MSIQNLFMDHPIDFEKRCKTRITVGILMIALGLLTLILAAVGTNLPILYLEQGAGSFIQKFYLFLGIGILAAGVVRAIRYCQILKNPEMKKARGTWEADERNRLLGLRAWSYAGYTMFLLLYLGILAGGFIGKTVMIVLVTVELVFMLVLLIFKYILRNAM